MNRIALGLGAVALAAGYVAFGPGEADAPIAAASLAGVSSARAAPADESVETSPSGMVLGVQAQGAEDAPVTVIEYVSLTCPHCGAFQEEVHPQLKSEFIDAGKIRYEVREVYFDRFGLQASKVARCAGPDRYFGFLDLFLTRQKRWTEAGDIVAELAAMGRQGGLSAERIEACLTDSAGERALVEMYQSYYQDPRLTGTPTLIVGEEKVDDPSFENLKAAIEAELD